MNEDNKLYVRVHRTFNWWYVEATPTGKWKIKNENEEVTLYIEVLISSVQTEQDIAPIMAHENKLVLRIDHNNECGTEEETKS